MEITILQWIQEHMRNPIMDQVMVWISYSGELGAIWIALALLLLIVPAWRPYRRVGLAMLISLALGGLTCNLLLKPIVARPRPFVTHPESYPHLVAYPSEYSFPSGHSTSSWAASGVLFWQPATWSWIALSYAFLMIFSRLYLFVHYPSDVLFGFVLGLLNAYVANSIVLILEKRYEGLRQFLAWK